MNKTTPIAPANIVQNGSLVYQWLGSLWTQLFDQQQLIKNYSQALSLSSEQLYLDFVETLALLDRRNAPVFHRERWKLLQLPASARNTGHAIAAKLGGRFTPKVGKQDSPPFIYDSNVAVGGHVGIAGVTAYPLPAGCSDILTSIVDSIIKPTVIWLRGVDFYVEDETIVFINGNDPASAGFPVIDTATGPELVAWASDVLIDKQYVYNQVGYVLGIRDASSEFYGRYLNGLWDLRNLGAPIALVKAGIAAVLDEPYVLDREEVVDDIISDDTAIQVVTDKHVYSLPSTAILRTAIVKGARLEFGDLFTQTIRFYDNLDPTRLTADSEYGLRLKTDVDALFLRPGFFRARLNHGLGVTWTVSPITFSGLDANGNPKLKFEVHGSEEDVTAFWQDFWDYCESRGISGSSCFPGRLRATLPTVEDSTWGTVVPVEYFLYNYLKANVLIVVIDGDRLSAAGRGTMHVLSMLKNAIPAHACLLIMERRTIPTDEYDAGERVEDGVRSLYCKQLHEVAGANEHAKLRLTYGDGRPIVHLIPKCVGAANENT